MLVRKMTCKEKIVMRRLVADKGETSDDIYELVGRIALMWGSPRIGVNGDLYLPLRRYGT